MKSTARIAVWCLMTLGLGITSMAGARAQGNVLRAHADLFGAPGSGISGVIRFTQSPVDKNLPEPEVKVVVEVEGLAPGLHGIHIHETGACTPPGFTSAGGHFDPGPAGNSNPDANHPFHMGDLPNLEANASGRARMECRTSRITLSPGPLCVFDDNGSAVIVHQNPDQGITGAPGSGVSGGPRVACGVIVMDEE